MNRKIGWAEMAGILALIVSLLAFLRDLFGIELKWLPVRDSLKRNARRMLFGIVFMLVGFSLLSLNSRIRGLESAITKRDKEIGSAYATLASQAKNIATLESQSIALEKDLRSAQATQTVQATSVNALEATNLALTFAKILPEAKRPQKVQLLDADGDEKNEWIVFYKFDLAVYDADHGDPPVVFPYELHPLDRVYLGEQNCVAEVRDLITNNEGIELLVNCYAEEGLVVDLGVFHWYDHDKDDLSKSPSEERQGYQCLGFFHGSGGITFDGSKVIVKERSRQLSIKRVYDVVGGSYFQPGGKELRPPVEKSVEFTFGMPEDVAQSPYPEDVVMAFYLALGQNNPLAQTYLSEASGLKNLVGSSNFGTLASGDQIQKVLVKRIIYTPDMEKEEKHEPVRVTITVSSVTNVGEDLPRDVTWVVVWQPSPEGVAEPGWKLHRMIFESP